MNSIFLKLLEYKLRFLISNVLIFIERSEDTSVGCMLLFFFRKVIIVVFPNFTLFFFGVEMSISM